MGIESQQTSIRASIQGHLNTLRARVYRNTFIASFKNYMGRHDQQMHTTLFNIANPSEGERKAGAGGEGVRGRAADGGDEAAKGAPVTRGQAGYAGYGERAKTEFAAEAKATRLAGESDREYVGRLLVSARELAVGDNFVSAYTAQGKPAPSQEQVQQAMAIDARGNSKARELFARMSQNDQDELVTNAFYTLRQKTDAGGKVIPEITVSKYHNEYLNRVASEAGLSPTAVNKMTPAQRNTFSEQVRAMQSELKPARDEAVKSRAMLRREQNLYIRLQEGVKGYTLVKFDQATLDRTGLTAEDFTKRAEGGSMQIRNIATQGPIVGATQEQVNAQRPVVVAAKIKADAAVASYDTQRTTLLGGLRGAKKTAARESRSAYLKPTLENYEANRLFFEKRQSGDSRLLANTREVRMWNTYDPALRSAEAKSPEAAGYAFTKNFFRTLAGTAIPGSPGLTKGNFPINDARIKKYSKSVTQEDFDKLWGMVGRAEQAKASGRTPQEMKEARGEMEAFLKETFGVKQNEIESYKELSDFQFSYKMLRRISSDLNILKSYKNRRSVNNIGSVVKQNMARYFRI